MAANEEDARATVEDVQMDDTLCRLARELHPWRDSTMVTNKGAIVVYHTYNQEGHSVICGASRLPRMPDAQLLNYLWAKQGLIKARGIYHWFRHVFEVNGSCGFGEKLTSDDFGMSLATRSADRTLHPTNKSEQGLWILDFPNLIDKIRLTGPLSGAEEEGEIVKEPIIFAYIHLYDAKKRRTALLSTLEGETTPAKTNPNGKIGTHVLPQNVVVKKLPPGATIVKKKTAPGKRKSEPAETSAGPAKQLRSSERIAKIEAWKEKQFPSLPTTKPPQWHKDGLSPFPEPDPSH